MAQILGSSWRTTIAGIAAIAGGVCLYIFAKPEAETSIEAAALIALGIGLIKARDDKNT